MSELHCSVLGAPSGKVGKLVFRRRRGKVFIYTAPIPYQPEPTVPFINNQKRFILLRKMAACTAKNHLLKGLWNESLLPGGVGFERQMSINYPIYNNDWDITRLKIVPSGELFPAQVLSFSYADKLLQVTVSIADAGFEENDQLTISPHGVMLLTDKTDDTKEYLFVPLSAKDELLIEGNIFNFKLPVDCEMIDQYQSAAFILCLVIRDILGTPMKYSVNQQGTFGL